MTKEEQKLRACIDYKPLNHIISKNRYPLPRKDDIIEQMSNVKVFSVCNEISGYNQISLEI